MSTERTRAKTAAMSEYYQVTGTLRMVVATKVCKIKKEKEHYLKLLYQWQYQQQQQ